MKYRDDRYVVYVSGPITAANTWEQEINARIAEVTAVTLMDHPVNLAPIIPHTMGRFYGNRFTRTQYMEIDLALLRLCDGMILLPGWEDSIGCNDELAYAEANGIPVLQLSWEDLMGTTEASEDDGDLVEKLLDWIDEELYEAEDQNV
jgi:hypothetical protein